MTSNQYHPESDLGRENYNFLNVNKTLKVNLKMFHAQRRKVSHLQLPSMTKNTFS